jgi:metal-responsive CopG/Arc/MetJ family transcriptional regulator
MAHKTHSTYNIYLNEELSHRLQTYLEHNPTVSRAKVFQVALRAFLDTTKETPDAQ